MELLNQSMSAIMANLNAYNILPSHKEADIIFWKNNVKNIYL